MAKSKKKTNGFNIEKTLINNKYLKIGIVVISLIISYFISLRIINDTIDKSIILNNNIYLWILSFVVVFYIFSHLIFPIKKIYVFIYKKRWIISLFLFLICVLGEFTMSSFGMWNQSIQPNNPSSKMNAIINKPLSIRSDEWLTGVPEILSQQYNNYDFYNDIIRGEKTDSFMASPLPIKNILMITRPFMIGYIFFGIDAGSSIFWFGRIIMLFMVTFEFIMLLTKGNKKISLITTAMISFGAPVAWWGIADLLISGEGAVVTLYYFLNKKNKLVKAFMLALLTLCILSYGFNLYPAWMIPLGYIYGALGLYYLVIYIKENKKEWKSTLLLIIPVIISALFVYYFYSTCKDAINALMGTVYPGSRFETGGSGYELNFNYVFNTFMKYTSLANPSEASVFYSFFPFTYLIVGYALFKDRKNAKLIILTLISIFMMIFMFVGIPTWLARITLIYFSPVQRTAVIFTYLMILMLAISLPSLKFKKISSKLIINVLAILFALLTVYISSRFGPDYVANKVLYCSIIVAIVLNLAIVNINEKFNWVLVGLIVSFFFGTYIVVNPISIELSSIYDKPLAKELTKYRENEKDSLWVSFDDITTGDYLIANGIKTINSVNTYPNVDRWHIIDEKHVYEDVYNRYAHITVFPTTEDTTFKLIQPDYFVININRNDLCKLNVDYVTSRKDMDEYDSKKVDFERKYLEDGIYIYKVNCND